MTEKAGSSVIEQMVASGDLDGAKEVAISEILKGANKDVDLDIGEIERNSFELYSRGVDAASTKDLAMSIGMAYYAVTRNPLPGYKVLLASGLIDYAKIARSKEALSRAKDVLDGMDREGLDVAYVIMLEASIYTAMGTLERDPVTVKRGAEKAWDAYGEFKRSEKPTSPRTLIQISMILIRFALLNKQPDDFSRAVAVGGYTVNSLGHDSEAMLFINTNMAACLTVISPLQPDRGLKFLEMALQRREEAFRMAQRLGHTNDLQNLETAVADAKGRLSEARR